MNLRIASFTLIANRSHVNVPLINQYYIHVHIKWENPTLNKQLKHADLTLSF